MLYLVFLLSVTVSSYRPELFRSPRELVTAYSHANKNTIKKLLQKIAEFREEGKLELERVNSSFVNAGRHKDQHQAEFDQATLENNNAKKAVETATNEKDDAQAAWDDINGQLTVKKEERKRSKAIYDQKKALEDKILTRTNAEAKDFEDLMKLLPDLALTQQGAGRRLLETGEGDVAQIQGYVNEMISASKAEAADATAATSKAKAVFDNDDQLYTQLSSQLSNAQAALTSAGTKLRQKKNLLTISQDNLKKAKESLAQAKLDLENAEELRDITKVTVDNDDDTLAQVALKLENLSEGE